MEVIRDHDGTLTDLDKAPRDWSGDIGIELHGSSSLYDPKHSYRIETADAKGEDLDVAFLDFPVDSDWVLVANYEDPSELRNALAYALARAVREPLGRWECGRKWAELYVNDRYKGLYLVTERVKRGEDRIDIDSPDATAKGDVSGGYIVKIDQCRNDCWSTSEGTYVSWEYPQYDDINVRSGHLHPRVVGRLRGADGGRVGDRSHVRLPRVDRRRFLRRSHPHQRARAQRRRVPALRLPLQGLGRGRRAPVVRPVWDFDRAFGNVTYCDCEKTSGFIIDDLTTCGYAYEYPFWYGVLLDDEAMQDRIRCRWEELRLGVFDDSEIDACSTISSPRSTRPSPATTPYGTRPGASPKRSRT
jgi:hypothetical protein